MKAPLEDRGCARCIPSINWRNHTKTKRKLSPKFGNNSSDLVNTLCSGFEAGWVAEAILGAKDSQQGIFYLVKWKDREDMDLIPALVTFTHVPSLVIHFYAKRVAWIKASYPSSADSIIDSTSEQSEDDFE